MRIVLSIVGKDRVGIIAMVSGVLAENQVNILNINQNILDGYFNMVMIADMSNATTDLQAFQAILKEKGSEYGVEIKVQHEDIFQIMHRI
ncbi:ACT domain-containing protein [Succinispira mobilis]|uniref:ACT domain-containing protein n=1 Tax=Succinispira mobilis TaxID=78120 RepID=UPI00038268D9|nr:ACT domain-containing protein [Succinispira mobilis]